MAQLLLSLFIPSARATDGQTIATHFTSLHLIQTSNRLWIGKKTPAHVLWNCLFSQQLPSTKSFSKSKWPNPVRANKQMSSPALWQRYNTYFIQYAVSKLNITPAPFILADWYNLILTVSPLAHQRGLCFFFHQKYITAQKRIAPLRSWREERRHRTSSYVEKSNRRQFCMAKRRNDFPLRNFGGHQTCLIP